MAYAENTEVSVEKSIGEIIGLIKKAGADRIAQVEEPHGFAIQFFLHDRMLRFRITWPKIEDVPQRAGNGVWRDAGQRARILEQRKKQRARALLLVIKAKLESVESGVETFEEAFLANVVMPDGKTVGDYTLPAIAESYSTGRMPSLMLPAPEKP
jgi:hypothetical protein